MSVVTAPWEHYGETQGYGATGNPAEPAQFGHDHWHDCRDYGVPMDTPVPAPIAGRVAFAGWDQIGYIRQCGRGSSAAETPRLVLLDVEQIGSFNVAAAPQPRKPSGVYWATSAYYDASMWPRLLSRGNARTATG